jgi:hypothetical protein
VQAGDEEEEEDGEMDVDEGPANGMLNSSSTVELDIYKYGSRVR